MTPLRRSVAVILLVTGGNALAHADASIRSSSLPWTFEPWVIGTIAASSLLYAVGLMRLWRHAGGPRGIRRTQAACFSAGVAALIVALVSPLDALGAELFAAHMAQHELLMLVAAPLLVAGHPLATWLWALPPRWRKSLGGVAKAHPFAIAWGAITTPVVGWIQHALVIWIWHAPTLFDAALAHPAVHALQHVSFLASALLFWWAILPRPGVMFEPGTASLYLFTTMLHTGALGTLLTLSNGLWYASYQHTTLTWGLTPLDDQQLGGLIMWIPAGAVYAGAGLLLIGRWLRSPRSAPITWSTER